MTNKSDLAPLVATAPARLYHIDWLRVVAVFLIFIYHSTRFFDTSDWHVKNARQYEVLDAVAGFFVLWGMPLVFVISGASTFYSLARRGPLAFLEDRTTRLLVPLVAGIFTHCAWQVYLERLTHGQFHGSFWEFLPHYFDGLYGFGGNFAWMGMHLWYLEMLFLFGLLCLPLLQWWTRAAVEGGLNDATYFLSRPGRIYLLSLPLIIVVNVLDPETLLGNRAWGGWSLPASLIFFLCGFIVVAHEVVQARIQRDRWVSLAIGVTAVLLIATILLSGGDPSFGTWRFAWVVTLSCLGAWCWILAVLGFALQHLAFATPALALANEGVLPFYVLHQTVQLSIGYLVIQWMIPDVLKWAVIVVASLIVILLAYASLIRQNDILRFLFGMKRLPQVSRDG